MKAKQAKPPKHSLKRTTFEPRKPDLFTGRCGYESTNGKEFTIHGKVTCAACIVDIRGSNAHG